MMNKTQRFSRAIIYLLTITLCGCVTTKRGNEGQVQTYPTVSKEAAWIKNGEPIEFEEEVWYPQDGIETLLDSEVSLISNYRGVQVFIDKIDVRPYARLYTKFSKNKFRYFKKRENQP